MFLVRSGAIEGFNRLVTTLGQNPVRLLSQAGLSESLLRNPNTYLSYSKLAELLELTSMACNEPLFGIRLAQSQTSTVLGDIGVTISQQPTIRDAFTNINKHLYLHARGVHIAQHQRGDDLQLELQFEISSKRGLNQLIQMSIGQLANFANEMLHAQKKPVSVYLRQSAPAAGVGQGYGKAFAAIVFDASCDCIQLPAKWLERKPHRDEEALRKHFDEYIQLLKQRYPDNLQDQVRDIVGQALPSGECSLERVAATLELHPRVLQKRLRAEGSSYVKLLQETRLTIAMEHLRFKSMSITDLALNLGYADVSVFSRNFRQHTGMSARQWQNKQGQQDY